MKKKINYFYVLLLFILFIPKVYAFTYEVETSVSNLKFTLGTETEIRVSLKNITGTNVGISMCSLNIEFDDNILLSSMVRTLGSWTLTTGKTYLFNTSNFALNDTELFVIPVKVNGAGSVKLTNIECFDGNTREKISNKVVNFVTVENNSSNNIEGDIDSSEQSVKDTDCDLSDILLNEGVIDFDPDVTEYDVVVSDYDSLIIEPVLANSDSTFELEKTDDYKVIIRVIGNNENFKDYTLFVTENINDGLVEDNSKFNYVPIFIGLICVLVSINIIRVVRNMVLNKKN